MANRWGKSGNSDRFYFLVLQNHCNGDYEITRCLLLVRKAMTNLGSVLRSRDITLLTKVHLVKAMVFPVVIHVSMWELDHKEGWGLKNWCFLTAVLEKTLESPLDSRENKPVNPKGNQLWLFIGKTDAEAEAPILWPTNAKSQFIGKDYDAGKDWRQEKGVTEDEMVGWHHWVQQTWIWANSRRQGRTGKPVVLQSMGLQRLTQLSLWTLTMLLCSLLKI